MLTFLRKNRNRILLILAIALFLWFVIDSQSFQQCVCNSENDYANQSPQERHPLFYVTISNHVGCIWHWLDMNSGAVIALFTIVIGGFTGFLFVDGRDKGRRELRAYVSVGPKLPIDTPILNEWHIKGVTFHLRNDGHTPAYGVCQINSIEVLPRNTFPDPLEFKTRESKLVLAPNAYSEIRFRFDKMLSEEQKQAILAGTAAIYLWGKVRYRDAFRMERWTKYCMVYEAHGPGTTEGAVGARLRWCAEGNETEESQ